MLWKSAFEKSAVCCLSSRLCLTMLPNRPLSAEKPLSERFLWKYSDKKSTGEAIIRVKISAQAPILVMFFLGIKNKETDLSNIWMTFLVLKYLSKRIDLMAAPIRLSIATALVKASHSESLDTPQPTYMPVGKINQREEMNKLFPILVRVSSIMVFNANRVACSIPSIIAADAFLF